MIRKQFELPTEDIVYLEHLGLQWETIIDRGMHWVIIYEYPVSEGYNIDKITVAIRIEAGYPRAALDMAYFFPGLLRLDGKPINATSPEMIDSKQFQRWSRHRTGENPWREGVDDLSSHMSLVSFWFEQEFIKKPNGIAA